jgi:hypothetical protein
MEDDEWLEFVSEIRSLLCFEQENVNKADKTKKILRV